MLIKWPQTSGSTIYSMTVNKTNDSFSSELSQLLKARNSVLLIESFEEDRVLEAIQDVVTDTELVRTPRQIYTYTVTNGLRKLGESKGQPQEPDLALKAALATKESSVFIFFDLHHYLGSSSRPAMPSVIRSIRDASNVFRSSGAVSTLIIVSPTITLPPDLEKTVTVLDFPLPDEKQLHEVLSAIIDANAGSERIVINLDESGREQLVKASLGLTRNEAENAFARAIVRDGILDASDVSVVLEEKSQVVRKSGILEFVHNHGSIEDIGGLENLKKWLTKRNDSWLDVAAEWGLPFPKGILITGVPGCGKSLTAKCSASLWGLPLLRLDVGRVFAGLVGSSEANMRAALKMAEAVAPSILWMDEIEKGFGDTSSSGDSGTSSRVFGSFLTWMQEKEKPVFVIATANNIEKLPPEFLRKGRFDEIFFVDLPTDTERKVIWQLHLRKRLSSENTAGSEIVIDEDLVNHLSELSEGFSGAEIEQAVIASLFDAFGERRPVKREDIERSVRNTVPLSITQAEKIRSIRGWASTRAVAATAPEDSGHYGNTDPEQPKEDSSSDDVSGWRGGRKIEF